MRLLSSFKRKDNAIEVASALLALQKIPVTDTGLEQDLQRHPDYPSLLSLSDTFTSYGIENISLKMTEKNIEDCPLPAIVPIFIDDDQKFTIVRSVSTDSVCFLDPNSLKYEDLDREQFNKIWRSRIVMALNSEEANGEKEYEQKRRRELSNNLLKLLTFGAFPLLTIFVIAWSVYIYGPAAITASLFVLSILIGLITSTLLIWLEIDENSPVLQKICKAGRKVNCNAIVSSRVSKIFGISWSSIGFVYFAGSLILLLIQGLNHAPTLLILAWMSAFAFPYTLFSITYQWKFAKQWCILCLVVQALLIFQVTIALRADWFNILSNNEANWATNIVPMIVSYLAPSIALTIALPSFTSSKVGKEHIKELQRFKHNSQIFNTLLERQKLFGESADGLGITLGNPNPKYKIIKVCNPYCNPCAKAHSPMHELLHNNPEVQLQIIFSVSEQSGDKALPVKHLLAIQEKFGQETTLKALDDWYLSPEKDYQAFSKKYPMNGEIDKQAQNIQLMYNWCDKTQISFTPTFVINGYQLPEMYNANDLKYLLSV